MKFVHMADMHFDRPFINLSDKGILGDLRRLEQRKVFKKVIEYIKQNEIEYLFISGDLYEHKYVKQTTIEYINKQFEEIPKTKIYIAPGNHDPYVKNSYYNKYKWNKNVKIFNSKIEKIKNEEIEIYGYGFDDFYCTNCGIEDLQIEDKSKINILIMHGTIDGALIEEKQYNSVNKKELEEKGFDYIALGHIHKPQYNTNIVYPGSTISLGFDEIWEHGIIAGKIEKEKLEIKFIPIDEEKFKEMEIDITQISSKEELIEKINKQENKSNEYIKIKLTGERNFEIDKYELLKYIENERMIKIKDCTKIAYNLEEIANESTLKGIFTKEMIKKLKEQKEEKEIIEKAIEIGLDALK